MDAWEQHKLILLCDKVRKADNRVDALEELYEQVKDMIDYKFLRKDESESKRNR